MGSGADTERVEANEVSSEVENVAAGGATHTSEDAGSNTEASPNIEELKAKMDHLRQRMVSPSHRP